MAKFEVSKFNEQTKVCTLNMVSKTPLGADQYQVVYCRLMSAPTTKEVETTKYSLTQNIAPNGAVFNWVSFE